MLSIPAFDEVEGVTVFRDDESPGRFYYLPRQPRLARGENGRPQFTFLRYQFALERPGAGGEPGGGYLVFTTVLREEDVVVERLRRAMQARLRAEMPTATTLPTVAVAPVDFTDGEVRLIIIQNDRFVKAVNLGKPSLFSNNTASVAVELTADGATLFYEALHKAGSVAAIEYDLSFPVRLPAITIRGHVDSGEVKTAVMGYTAEKLSSEDTWGNEESHEAAHRSSISEVMESQGLIQLEILKGNVDLSQEDMESLRAFAFQGMDTFVKDHFLKGGTIETEEDRKSQWMGFLHQDIHQRFDLNVSYRDVINREYHPSAQVNPSFLGVPVDQVLIDIDLGNAPWFFNTLSVRVDTNLDFSKYGDIVHSVVGHLSYDETRPDGTRLTRRESVAFNAEDHAPKTFETRLAAVGKDRYHVDVEVNYKAGPVPQAVIASFDTVRRDLTLDVPNPGVIEIALSTAPKAFDDRLVAIETDIEYADPRRNVPRVVETVLLNAETPAKPYRRVIYAAWDKPYRYRLTYVLKDESGNVQRATGEWAEGSSGQRNLNLPTPFGDAFSLNVIPSVDWEEVRELVVDLEYVDAPNDYRVQRTLSFSKDQSNMTPWKFLLRDKTRRGFRYKVTALLQNNAAEEGEWQTRDSDGALKVGNAPFGTVKVDVDPGDLDFGGEVKRAVVQLSYSDPAQPRPDRETLLFRDTNPQTWTVTLGPAASDYTYDVTYFMRDNTRRSLTGQRGTLGAAREFLIVPTPPGA